MKKPAAILAAFLLAASLPALTARYYFSPECGSCRDFLGKEVPRVEKLVGQKITIELHDIRQPEAMEDLVSTLAERGLVLTVVPVLFVGDTVLVGGRQIAAGFEGEVRKQLSRGEKLPAGPRSQGPGSSGPP